MQVKLFVLLLIVFSAKINATIINVPSEQSSIQAGINASSDGDTVLVAPGIYFENLDFDGHKITLASEFIISGDTSVIPSTVIDGGSVGAVITIDRGVSTLAWITGLTIQNGSQGGISCYSAFPTVEYNIIQNNQGRGIDIYGDSSGFAIIRNNKIISNSSTSDGGGLRYYGGDAQGIVTGNIFENNTGEYGGGAYVRDEVYMTGNVFRENHADRKGDGLYCYFAEVDLSDCVFDGNEDGIYAHRSSITASGMTVSGNDGAGIVSSASPITLTDCDFLNNGGRGITSSESPLNLADCLFSENSGGGVMSYDTGFIHIENSVFENNSATYYGGGIMLWYTSLVEIYNCTFSSNQAGAGGAIAIRHSVVDIQDCLFDDNLARGSDESEPMGGAIHAVACSLGIENATIVNNIVLAELPWPPEYGFGGGISVLFNAFTTVSHSLFVGNSAPEGSSVGCYVSQPPTLTCSDIYGNAGGDWTGCIENQIDMNGNFSLNPLFCDNFHISSASPCAPANNACGELIGALGIGCATEPLTFTLPETLYTLQANTIYDTFTTNIYIGDFTNVYNLIDVIPDSIRVNNSINPSFWNIISSHPNLNDFYFNDSLMEISIPVKEFILGYGMQCDTTDLGYNVTGYFNDMTSFLINGTFTMIGHRSGDVNNDGLGPDISDLSFLINYIFKGGDTPEVFASSDLNADGQIFVDDLTYFVNYLFKAGPAPLGCP